MKKVSSITLIFGLTVMLASAQEEVSQTPAEDACACIANIDINEDKKTQNEQIKKCIKDAIMSDQLFNKLSGALEKAKDSTANGEDVNITINAMEGYEKIERELIDDCKALNILLNNAKPSSVNSYSDNEKAMEYYNQGYQVYNAGNFEKAVELYGKAVKEDKDFAFAWDMLGVSHRRLDNYKEAIKAYKTSLKVDPYGRMPLQNLPIVYRLEKDYEKAAKAYQEFIKQYPNDPEGYFGLSQCGLLLKDYELAADNIFPAYKMYAEVNSPYKQDAEKVLSAVYQGMKENGTLDKFREYAEKHKVEITE
ncbi:Tetratricopeptide repeat-containing protein [Nonlabens sp. Hel1_33_55]|uniref:tetratricopeptide repeat protein n=1 Tax=Nonlabens sp. Hel1_33_55 TaxID=1336802 RepID=UPI000875CAA6|nr:tetratricopeptide repeat protein [Nonlabens sp. Hel1_33_55]SCY35037.1 Tetratricopeptide repeat-containing protein [Nonlabens sp. Hel1_33_55]